MEQDQEHKHVCKFCKKKFPCGRSLGGHMRSHMLNSSSEANKDKKSTTTSSVFNGGSDFEASGAGGYGLRENPKKTWRFSDSFGHIRSEHSVFEKEHGNSWIDENQELVLDSQSDNEAVAPKRKRRSRRMRYNTTTTAAAAANINTNVTTVTATTTVTTSSSFSFANGSTTCVSEIEQEQEEVAMCLMMLSRDVGYWGGLNSVVESSDNNSVVFEVSDRKFKSLVFESQSVRFHKRRSEFERNGIKKLESDEYIGDENKLNEVDDQVDSECGKYNSKKKRCDALDYEMRNDDLRTKAKYKCTTCNRTFRSYQALGGHRASHKKEKGYLASKIETSENSIETDTTTPELIPDSYIERVLVSSTTPQTSSPPLKKTKHECPICFKVFASGQALGGHKRSHTIEVSEARSNETIVMQQQPRQLPQVRDLLDLNLPAPVEEDNTANSCIPFKPWWMETSHTHEPPAVGVITN